MAVFYLKLIAFLVLLAFCADCAGALLEGGEDGARVSSALSHVPSGSVDVLFLGSSHAHFGIVPQQMYDQYGITGALATGDGMNLSESYWMLRYALERQAPKLIVLDLFYAAAPYLYTRKANAHAVNDLDMLNDPHVQNMMTSAARRIPILSPNKPGVLAETYLQTPSTVFGLFNLTKFKSRYQQLGKPDFDYVLGQTRVTADFGYCYDDRALELETVHRAAYSEQTMRSTPYDTLWDIDDDTYESAELHEKTRWELERIIALAKSRGIPLVLCAVPYVTNRAEDKLFSQVKELAEREGATYLSMEDFGLNDPSLMSDLGHLNARGARLFTDRLGSLLVKRFELPDRRTEEENPQYAPWRNNAGGDEQLLSVKRLAQSQSLQESLSALGVLGDSYAVLLIAQGAAPEELTQERWQTLRALGANTPEALSWYENGAGTLVCVLRNGEALFSAYADEGAAFTFKRYLLDQQITFSGGDGKINWRVGAQLAGKVGNGLSLMVYGKLDNELLASRTFAAKGK